MHDVVARLRAAGCVAAEEEAALLESASADPVWLAGAVARREAGEPLAWILGRTRFGGDHVGVAPGVYVPRPHTEALAASAAALLTDGGVAVDLCCGSGAIAAHLARAAPLATVVGVDVDLAAAACAASNGVRSVRADVRTDGVPLRSGSVDLVTAVPPYVPSGARRLLAADVQRHEPGLALDGGVDGLDVARAVVVVAARLLRPAGHLLLELGGEQDGLLAPILAAAGFGGIEAWHDADGDLRGVAAVRDRGSAGR